ncbi:hypothetical protein C2845_PM01G44260 [Panicum miliaceum]|uniref:Cysteine proteinase inhibitor n=1 Tax=Panicum miliaceum TaxID=4540 RepID=A0A3L6TNB7_PANMI|nr:hypothetical protein C2845_PM01G44260 [Panicum miliaceum]
MRPWLLLFVLLAARASGGSGGAAPSLPGDAAAAAVAVAVVERREHHGGHAAAPDPEGGAFFWRVGRFAVMVHSMWHEIKPVPRLERVVSASTRPAEGGGVDYLLVLRVAPPLGTCRALVWGVPGEGSQDWKLKYFEPVAGA